MKSGKNGAILLVGGVLLLAVGVAVGWFLAGTRQPSLMDKLDSTDASSLSGLLNSPDNASVPVAEKVRTTLQGVVVEVGSDRLVIQDPTYRDTKLVGPKATLLISDRTILSAKVPNAGVSAPAGSNGEPPRPMEPPKEPFRDLNIKLGDLKANDLVEFTVTEEMSPDIMVKPESVVWIATIVRVEAGDKVIVSTEGRFTPTSGPAGATAPPADAGIAPASPGPRPN